MIQRIPKEQLLGALGSAWYKTVESFVGLLLVLAGFQLYHTYRGEEETGTALPQHCHPAICLSLRCLPPLQTLLPKSSYAPGSETQHSPNPSVLTDCRGGHLFCIGTMHEFTLSSARSHATPLIQHKVRERKPAPVGETYLHRVLLAGASCRLLLFQMQKNQSSLCNCTPQTLLFLVHTGVQHTSNQQQSADTQEVSCARGTSTHPAF